MPICPGCEQQVPYDRLDTHERYCEGIWSGDRHRSRSVERLDRRLAELERRVEQRFRTVESKLEQQLSRTEGGGRSAREVTFRE